MNKQDLPKILPVFPLSNFIIFPETTVPLNIFEARYVEMINDSMKKNKLIGLIQPKKNNTNFQTMTFDEFNLFVEDYAKNAEYPNINN